MRLKRAKTAPETITSIPCFSKVHSKSLTSMKAYVSYCFWLKKNVKRIFHFKRQNVKTAFSVCLNSERHRVPQAGRLAPPSSFPGSHTPHPSSKSPQPWTLSVSTCASLVYTYFRHRLAECVLGYLLLCCLLFGLMKGVLGVLCFQTAGKLFQPPHTPSVSFSHSVNYPAFHPCVNSPYFTSMLLSSVEKLGTVLT